MVVELKTPNLTITNDSGESIDLSEGYVKICPHNNNCCILKQNHTILTIAIELQDIMNCIQQSRQ